MFEKIITPNSPNLVKDINLDSRNSADPKQNNSKKTMYRHRKVKLRKAKGKKPQKQLVKNAFSIGFTAELNSGTKEARRHGNSSLEVLKAKNSQSRILYPMIIFFRNKCKIKTFSDIGKLIEFPTGRPALKELLK